MANKHLVDARGSFCPGPLLELIAQLRGAAVGDEFEILSTDKGSANDIPEWVNKVGHAYVSTQQEAGVWRITIRKMK